MSSEELKVDSYALALDPPSHKFKRDEEAALEATLQATDRTSDLVHVRELSDVLMHSDTTLGKDHYRLTTWGLYQLCRSVCSGLYRVLQELTAIGDLPSKAAAVGILNQVLRLRFQEKLAGQRLLVDRTSGMIEAVVSTRYKLFPNLQLYQHVAAAMKEQQHPARFYEAWLNGRWFMLRYYQPKLFLEHAGHRYFTGFHYSNHEGGHASLHAANMLLRQQGRFTLLTPTTRDRHVRHAGKQFGEKLQRLLSRVLNYRFEPATLEAGLKALAQQNLGLGQLSEEAEQRRHDDLSAQLNRRGLQKTLTNRIIAGALHQSYDEEEATPSLALERDVVATRTALDLVGSAGREAKKCSIALREAVERTAFALVMGKFKLR